MTAFQEIRYHCDRCDIDEVAALASGVPPQERMAGPKGWLMLRLGTDPSTPAKHLCEKCAEAFTNFMQVPKGDEP